MDRSMAIMSFKQAIKASGKLNYEQAQELAHSMENDCLASSSSRDDYLSRIEQKKADMLKVVMAANLATTTGISESSSKDVRSQSQIQSWSSCTDIL